MADRYVKAATGSDSPGAGSAPGTPYASPDYAISQASAGDTIWLMGPFHTTVTIDKAGLTFKSYPSDPATIDGEFTLPTTSGGSNLVAPNGTPSYYSALVTIKKTATWDGIAIRRSKGRCLVVAGTAASYVKDVIVKNATFDHANNAVINCQYTDGLQIINVKAYYGGQFYTVPRDPAVVNWPVCFNVIYSKNALIRNCVSAYHWGEGLALGRNTVNSVVEQTTVHDALSVGIYVHRCQGSVIRRCLLFHTHTYTPSSRGIVVQNEDNFAGALEATDNTIEDCISIGHTKNFEIAGNENADSVIKRIKLLNCTGINARGPNGVSDAKGCLSLTIKNHEDITLQGNIFYQDSGDIARVSGTLAPYTLGKNAFLGPGAVAAGLRKASDITTTLVNPDVALPQGTDIVNVANYKTSVEAAVGIIAGADLLDYYGNSRAAGTVGAIEYNGAPPGDSITITSAAATEFIEESAGSFTVTTTGSPTAIQVTGTLPSGVTFVDNSDGTATLAGTPDAATAGTYPLLIEALNGASTEASQNFVLTVSVTPTPPAGGTQRMVITRVVCNTSTGDQVIPIDGLANAPTAALFVLGRATADFDALGTPTYAAHVALSIGATDGTTSWAISGIAENGQTLTDTARYAQSGSCIYLRDPVSGVDAEASFSSFDDGEITITWSNAPGGAYYLIVYAFDATTAYSGIAAVNTTVNQKTTVSAGLETQLGFVAGNARGIPNTTGNSDNLLSIGVIGNTSGLAQKCYAMQSDDNAADAVLSAQLVSDRCAAYVGTGGGLLFSIEASNITSTDIDFYTRNGTPGTANDIGVLLLEFDGEEVYVGTDTTPTTNTTKEHAGPGFYSGSVGIIGTHLTALDTATTDFRAGGWGMGGATGDASAVNAWADKDGAATSETFSASDDWPLLVAAPSTALSVVAAQLSQFTQDGVELSYVATYGSPVYIILWAIENNAAIPVYMVANEQAPSMASAIMSTHIGMVANELASSRAFAFLSITTPALAYMVANELASTQAIAGIGGPIIRRKTAFPSPSSSTRLSIEVYEPLSVGNTQIGELSRHIAHYEHEVSRVGGFWSASIDVNAGQDELEEWYESGLGRRITTRSPYGDVIWEGFVNQVTLNLGGATVSTGPVTSIVNTSKLVYSYVDTSGSEALVGLRAETDYLQNFQSIQRWGALIRVLSTGGATPETAAELLSEYVREYSNPQQTQQNIQATSTPELSIRLDCLGYVHYGNMYVYNNFGTGVQLLSDKLIAVLNTEPNNFFTHEFGQIEANALLEPVRESDDATAWGLIKAMLAKGGTNNLEREFGIGNNRVPYYRTIEREISYYQYLSDPRRRILNKTGQVIEPWHVQPGRWIFTPDLLVGRITNTDDLLTDPRAQLIENVRFQAPYTVVVEGAKVRRLDQKLARLGLAGLGG